MYTEPVIHSIFNHDTLGSANPYITLPLLSTIPSYLLERLHTHTLNSRYPEYPRGSFQRRWWILLERFKSVGKGMELIGFLLFLVDGK